MDRYDIYDYDIYGWPGDLIYGDDVYVDDYYMEERWKPIDGFPNYWVSDKARVYSTKTKQFLTIKSSDNHGHLGVDLSRDGKAHDKYIHRLVAEAFIPNPDNLPIVRHKYDNPQDNEPDDLEWGTQYDNAMDSIRNGTAYMISDADREKGFEKIRTPVNATNINTGETILYKGQTEAARELGLSQSNVWKVLNGERKHTGGYYFEYADKGDRA